MKKNVRVSTIIGIVILILFACGVIVFGYRVVVTSGELPGKLGSVSSSASQLQYTGPSMRKVSKVDYEVMRYGYMDDLLLAQMDLRDQYYEGIRLAEIRAVNDLTAMSQKTADNLAYQEAKAEQEKIDKEKRDAARAAEEAKKAKAQALASRMVSDLFGEDETTYVNVGDSTDLGSGDTQSRGGKIGKPVVAKSHGPSLGKFVITAYCTCRICCGVYSGHNRTASGTVPTSNRTIAVDTSVIPFGTKVVINGQVYVAEDRGGAIKGNRIDMFYYTHKEATRWGRRTMEVYLAE